MEAADIAATSSIRKAMAETIFSVKKASVRQP
jgi:hypothetical protein